MNTAQTRIEDERVLFLRQLLANATLKRTNKKTPPDVAVFASEWEKRFAEEITRLESEMSHVEQPTQPEAKAA